MSILHKGDGTILTEQSDIHNEVMEFYRKLMGSIACNLRHIDIQAMRDGKQITFDQGAFLTATVTEAENAKALQGIGDLKALGIDGYGAKFFKNSWRLGSVIQDIVHTSQADFVPGQVIHNHILLATELMKGYTRKGGTPRCMMQIDLQKAYDMVDWGALEGVLTEFGLPKKFIGWVMKVITTVNYRFNINGELSNVLEAKRGIRQGDPISPLLGDEKSIEMILKAFSFFSKSTGLQINPAKCKVFCGGLNYDNIQVVKNITGFEEGTLPVRYLGVPLSCKKLNVHHYLPLVEKIVGRIRHCAEVKRKSPVAWKQVCKPARCGGLNLINLELWNLTAMLKCLWNICSKDDNLWVKWIHAYFLKGNNVMSATVKSNSTWILKSIMKQRPQVSNLQ
ncbi:uncharacterized protein [Glycine max]|uniref:uncharacterized protein n=1 Tax=Glycine max TaxID=3847 RepID=UPI0007190868|nr:uncharacterized protein LOC106794720 [Glycine max]|eukprot:XP_014618090.1 uncharacterized protein LOC106794720 [Glycine max]